MPEPTPDTDDYARSLSDSELEVVALISTFQMSALTHARAGGQYVMDREAEGDCTYDEMVAPFQFLRRSLAVADSALMVMLLTGNPAHLSPIVKVLEKAVELEAAYDFAQAVEDLSRATQEASAAYYHEKRSRKASASRN